MREVGKALGQRIEADEKERDGRKVEAERIEKVAGNDEPGRCEKAERPCTGKGDSSRRKVAHRGARIGGVEATIDDAIEGHSTSPRANHGGNNEAEGAPAGPAALIARCYGHRGQSERKSEDGVGEFNEFGPGANVRKHEELKATGENRENRDGTGLGQDRYAIGLEKLAHSCPGHRRFGNPHLRSLR